MSGETRPPGDDAGKRLLFIVSDAMTADILMRDQLASLREAGFEVLVVASPGNRLAEVAEREGVETRGVAIEREITPLSDLLSLFRLWRTIRQWRPLLVNASTPKAGALGMLAARIANVPVRIYTARGLRLETVSGWRRRLLAAGERLAASNAHQVIAVSPSLGRRIVELGLCPQKKIKVLGSGASAGVDCRRFRPVPADEPRVTRLRESLAIPGGAPVIGFVGRFTHDKGIADLAEAFLKTIRGRVPEACLLLVGDSDATDQVSPAVTARLRRDPRVVFSGFVDRPEDFYPLMDVLAFPSYREGFPNAPLEAAACEVPVAGYAATGTIDAVADGETGTLAPVGEVASLAEAICRYLEEPDLRRRHGRRARERVEASFGREEVSQAWIGEYWRLIDSRV